MARGLPLNEVHVWLAWLDGNDSPGRLRAFEALLSDEERARMGRFAFDRLKREFLVTRALCRTTLSRYAPVAPQDWAFEQNAYGRPRIAGAGGTLDFNLSHAGGLVAMAVADSARQVGIDVECALPERAHLDLARRYFSPAEHAALEALPAERQVDRFFVLWTLKEAYIKARGMGLSLPLDAFSVDPEALDLGVMTTPGALDEPGACWQLQSHRAGPRHWLALCARRDAPGPATVRWFDADLTADPSKPGNP